MPSRPVLHGEAQTLGKQSPGTQMLTSKGGRRASGPEGAPSMQQVLAERQHVGAVMGTGLNKAWC